ncbi:MAG: hypothetical protein V1872_11490 [bacterium]
MPNYHCYCCLSIIFYVAIISTACSPNLKFHRQVDDSLAKSDYKSAIRLVEENKDTYKERNAVLYYMDVGILSHYGKEYEKSRERLTESEKLIDNLFTISIVNEVSAFIVNDNLIPYRGEDFERVMINLFQAFNYLQLGKVDDALVEARKVDEKLALINSKYDQDKKNIYKEDAFVRYLMGILYEIGGTREDINDAYISYKKAEEIYNNDYKQNYGVSAPNYLAEDILTTAKYMGMEEYTRAQERYPSVKFVTLNEKKKKTEVFFIHFNGKIPEKQEDAVFIPILPYDYIMKIAFPKYVERPFGIVNSRIKLTGIDISQSVSINTMSGENIKSIAIKNLDNRKARIIAKATARALLKYGITEGTSRALAKKGNKNNNYSGKNEDDVRALTKFVMNIFGMVTEKADTRTCMVLPAEIRIAKALIEPGNYDLKAECLSNEGALIKKIALGNFTFKAGDKRFVFFRTVE